MGNKNKTVSFRVNEETFEKLRSIASERELSLSTVFRDYVDLFVKHEGQVKVIPQTGDESEEFPPRVEVPTDFIRKHERLELENEHLQAQIDEYEEYINRLKTEFEQEAEDVIFLEDLDQAIGDDTYHLG